MARQSKVRGLLGHDSTSTSACRRVPNRDLSDSSEIGKCLLLPQRPAALHAANIRRNRFLVTVDIALKSRTLSMKTISSEEEKALVWYGSATHQGWSAIHTSIDNDSPRHIFLSHSIPFFDTTEYK